MDDQSQMGRIKGPRKAATVAYSDAAVASASGLKQTANYIIQEQSMDDSLGSTGSSCCTKECCLHYSRKIITFLISRVGLMIIVVGYVLAGGLTIEALEAENEKKALQLSDHLLENMLQRIYRQIESNSTRVKEPSFYTFLRSEIRSIKISNKQCCFCTFLYLVFFPYLFLFSKKFQ